MFDPKLVQKYEATMAAALDTDEKNIEAAKMRLDKQMREGTIPPTLPKKRGQAFLDNLAANQEKHQAQPKEAVEELSETPDAEGTKEALNKLLRKYHDPTATPESKAEIKKTLAELMQQLPGEEGATEESATPEVEQEPLPPLSQEEIQEGMKKNLTSFLREYENADTTPERKAELKEIMRRYVDMMEQEGIAPEAGAEETTLTEAEQKEKERLERVAAYEKPDWLKKYEERYKTWMPLGDEGMGYNPTLMKVTMDGKEPSETDGGFWSRSAASVGTTLASIRGKAAATGRLKTSEEVSSRAKVTKSKNSRNGWLIGGGVLTMLGAIGFFHGRSDEKVKTPRSSDRMQITRTSAEADLSAPAPLYSTDTPPALIISRPETVATPAAPAQAESAVVTEATSTDTAPEAGVIAGMNGEAPLAERDTFTNRNGVRIDPKSPAIYRDRPGKLWLFGDLGNSRRQKLEFADAYVKENPGEEVYILSRAESGKSVLDVVRMGRELPIHDSRTATAADIGASSTENFVARVGTPSAAREVAPTSSTPQQENAQQAGIYRHSNGTLAALGSTFAERMNAAQVYAKSHPGQAVFYESTSASENDTPVTWVVIADPAGMVRAQAYGEGRPDPRTYTSKVE